MEKLPLYLSERIAEPEKGKEEPDWEKELVKLLKIPKTLESILFDGKSLNQEVKAFNINLLQNPFIWKDLIASVKPIYKLPVWIDMQSQDHYFEQSWPANEKKEFMIQEEKVLKIGTHASNQIKLKKKNDFNEFHGELSISFQESSFPLQIIDLGSTQGIFIRIASKYEMKENMLFEMGSHLFKVIKIEKDCLEFVIWWAKDPTVKNSEKYILIKQSQKKENSISFQQPFSEKFKIISGDFIKVGRIINGNNVLSFPEDLLMSRNHATIEFLNDKVFLKPEQATNFVWIRLSEENKRSNPYILQNNDLIRFGQLNLFFVEKKF